MPARYISIHAAREGGDKKAISHIGFYVGFQSTPPVKAATVRAHSGITGRPISIHAAREGGDAVKRWGSAPATISIHAAREGGDVWIMWLICKSVYFNPRRP